MKTSSTKSETQTLLNTIVRKSSKASSFPKKHDAEDLANADKAQNIELKKSMFKWTKLVVSLWLLFIIVFMSIVLLFKEDTNPEIIITLLATTTINIIGLPLAITRSLFR